MGALKMSLNKITDKISNERKALGDQYHADLLSSTTKRDDEIARSEGVLQGVKDHWDGVISAAQTKRDAALTEQTTQQKLYANLVTIKNDKQAALDAARTKQQDDGNAGRQQHTDNTANANQRYDDNAARILDIKNVDTDYLNEELGVIDIVEKIVAEIGITNEVSTDVQK